MQIREAFHIRPSISLPLQKDDMQIHEVFNIYCDKGLNFRNEGSCAKMTGYFMKSSVCFLMSEDAQVGEVFHMSILCVLFQMSKARMMHKFVMLSILL